MAKGRKGPVVPKTPTDPPPKKGRGTLLGGTVNAPAKVEVRITDANYAVNALADDVKNDRAWFEGPADKDGWLKLYYSADGPTGDPFPIGKIRFSFDATVLDGHFKNMSKFKVSES